MKNKNTKSESKQYDLKPIQVQMIRSLQDNHFNLLSNFLSFIALEFWAYNVTPNTRFSVSEDNKVTIVEVNPEEPPKQPEEKIEVDTK